MGRRPGTHTHTPTASPHGNPSLALRWRRRILSRPWTADEYVKNVVLMFARGKDSPAQMLHHSVELRERFANICREFRPQDRRGITNLRAAKHRFESFQKPLSRSIRLFNCLHTLMVNVGVERSDAQGARARAWLEWVSESPRHMLTAAMLADAADEASALLRFCDNESMDVAMLSDQITLFLHRANVLFGDRRECLTQVGYTKYCLDMLSEPLVWAMRGKMCSITRPTDNDVNFCLDHLRGWLKLASAEIRAEFPDFEIAQASSGWG